MVTVGVALAGLMLVTVGDMRAESRAERETIRAEIHAYRAEARAEREAIRAEARDYRAEARTSREAFEKQIIRLVEQQGTFNGLVEGLRHPIASPPE